MEYYDDQLEQMESRLKTLEKSLSVMQGNMSILTDQLKDTQAYLMRMAKSQSEIAKRITNWPYIAVPQSDQD
jgi:chaperonin cofactor prefoldin